MRAHRIVQGVARGRISLFKIQTLIETAMSPGLSPLPRRGGLTVRAVG